MNNPNDKPSNKIILNSGSNTIFCKNKPKSISVFNNNDNKIDLNIEQGEDINAYNYTEIIGKDKITYIIQKTSINKKQILKIVVANQQNIQIISQISIRL